MNNNNFHNNFTSMVTWISVLIILIFTFFHSRKINKAKKNIENANLEDLDSIPPFYNTLGILGTFVGIFFGLLFFKVNNISQSIPDLLNGLRTAFITSIMGIIISLRFSYVIKKLKFKKASISSFNDNKSIMVEILNEIKNMNQNQKAIFSELVNSIKGDNDYSISTQIIKLKNNLHDSITNQINLLTKIQQSLGSDSDTSLLTNIIRLRDEQKEGLKSVQNTILDSKDFMGKKFDEFGSILEKSNTEALVKVIENVIGGFNERLNELIERLVKENFEELNNSVKNLNEWQQKNKQQVEDLILQYEKVSTQLAISSEKLEKISSYTQELVEGEGKLKKLIEELEQVLVKNTTLNQAAENLLSSTKSFENSLINLKSISNEQSKEHERLIKSIDNLVDDLKEIEKLRDKSGEFWNDIKRRMEEGIQILEKGNNDLNNKIKLMDEAFYERMNVTFKNLDKILQNVIFEYAERIKKLIAPDEV